MIQASAKTTPRPVARHPAIRPLAQSYIVMTSWTMTETTSMETTMSETMMESMPAGTTGQPIGNHGAAQAIARDRNAARPGLTRMTVLVDRTPEQVPAQTPERSQAPGVTPVRTQVQAPNRVQAQQVFPQYAAVPTDLGWVIVEL
jgi:hypothetical protein